MNKFSVGDIVIPRRVPTGYPAETTPALEKLIGVSAPVVAVWRDAVCCHGFIWYPECLELATEMKPEREIVIRKMPGSKPGDSVSDDYCPGWHVQEGDLYADGLCWDEMLGTVAEMTMDKHKRGWLKTAEQHRAQREAWRQKDREVVWTNVYRETDGTIALGVARETEAAAKDHIYVGNRKYLFTTSIFIPAEVSDECRTPVDDRLKNII